MNRHILLLPALLFLAVASLNAQTPRRGGADAGPQGTITGTVTDSASGEALARASVALRSAADSSLVTGAITERDGSFSINGVRPGRYYARVSFVGYTTRVVPDITVTPSASTVELGKITMTPATTGGDEVTVNARREFMTMAIDRTIYKTGDLQVASGGTTMDVLRNIPAIDVDANDNISLKGSQNVVIQINGRPSMVTGAMLATFLRGLPADAVERVEVIPNPSAKYDPDGMSGIINIVLKQNTDRGTSGGVTGSIGTHDNYSIGGNVSYGSGPWSLFANYGFNYSDRNTDGSYTRKLLTPGPIPFLEGNSGDHSIVRGHVVNANVDYALSKAHMVSLAVMSNARISGTNGLTGTSERDTAMVLTRRYNRSSAGDGDGSGADLRLDYKWTIQPSRQELTAEVRYNTEKNANANGSVNQDIAVDGSPANQTPARQNTRDDFKSRVVTLQADYTQPVGDQGRIEAGYKSDLEVINNGFYSENFDYSSGLFRPDASANNTSEYDRNIHAAYLTYGHELGRFSAQAGVRAEQALTTFTLGNTGDAFRTDYFSLFPSAFVMYKPDDAWQFKASYSRRINRPMTMLLNPFSSTDDPNFRRSGNPNLKPEYTDAYELTASIFGDRATLTTTGFYRRTTDVMRRYGFTDTAGVTTVTWTNFNTNETYGADLTGTLKIGDWFSGFAYVSAYQNVTNAGNVDTTFNNNAFQWSFRVNGTFTPMLGTDLQITYFLKPAANMEGARLGAFTMTDVSLTQRLLEGRARIGVRVSDPFNVQKFSITRVDESTDLYFYRKWTSRTLALTFSYTFGTPDRTRRNQGGQQRQNMPDFGM